MLVFQGAAENRVSLDFLAATCVRAVAMPTTKSTRNFLAGNLVRNSVIRVISAKKCAFKTVDRAL